MCQLDNCLKNVLHFFTVGDAPHAVRLTQRVRINKPNRFLKPVGFAVLLSG